MADFNANEMFEKLLHDLKDQFPLLDEELITNILLENNCNLEATTQELLLYHSLPSSPQVYQQPKPLIEVPKSLGDLSEEDAMKQAIDQSKQLAMLEEKERQDILRAQSESQKLFALENDSSVMLNKWRQSAGQIAEHHVFIVCPKNASGIIVGKGFKHVKAINSKVGFNCRIRFISNEVDPAIPACFAIEADTRDAVNAAADALNDRIAYVLNWDSLHDDLVKDNVAALAAHGTQQAKGYTPVKGPAISGTSTAVVETCRHVFVDNSNIFIGAQNFGESSKFRLDILKFGGLLKKGQEHGTYIVAGSKPPINNIIWRIWDNAGFKVKTLSRDTDTKKEDGVDDFLHAQMYKAISKTNNESGTNVLVLATGDGNANSGWATFVDVVQAAVNNGWLVELWSWRNSFSNKLLQKAKEYPVRISVVYLDDLDLKLVPKQTTTTTPAPPIKGNNSKLPSPDSKQAHQHAEDQYSECVICMSQEATHAIIPCGHHCLCQDCVDLVSKCPMCNGDKTGALRIY